MGVEAVIATQVIDTTTVGRSLMTAADAAAARTALSLGTLATQSGTFSGTSSGTNTGDQTTISGNAGSATVLQTARNINGVSFDGSANITVTAAGSTLSDTVTVAKGGTGLTALGTALQVLRVNAGATALEYAAASGMAIGSSVTSATAGSIFFAGAAGILAQDNASLFFDDANNRLGIGTAAPTQPIDVSNTGTAGQIRYRWASDQCLAFGGDGMQGPYLASHTNPNDTSFGAYAAVKLNFGAGGFIVSIAPSVAAGGARTFIEACRISTTTQIGLLTCTSASLKGLVVKAAASQSANLQEWQNSSGTALSVIRPNGGIGVASLADADAANSTLYYSTDAAKLVWKDAGGVVNNLY